MRAIHSAKAAWVVAKEADVVAKVRTAVIMDKKTQGEMGIVSIGDVAVLGPTESIGTRGSDDVGSESVAMGTVDAGMWGSSAGVAGGSWSSIGSCGRGGAPGTNCYFSIVEIALHS